MFVLIDRDMARDTGDQSTEPLPKSEAAARVVDAKDEAIRMLKDQLEAERENRRIIAGLVQRVPELEATPEPPDAPETGSPKPCRGGPPGRRRGTGEGRFAPLQLVA